MVDNENDIVLPLVIGTKASSPGRQVLMTNKGPLRSRKWFRMAAMLIAGAVVGACLQPATVAMFGDIAWLEGEESASPSKTTEILASAVPEPLVVVALGRLLPLGDIVALALALPSGAGDARVARLLVVEGERVDAGQVIAELDNLPQLLAQKSSAAFELAAQRATLEQTRAAMLASYREARANHTRAKAALTLANQELARTTKLSEKKLSTQTQLEQAQSTAAQASAEIDRIAALLERYAGIEDGGQSDIILAQRNVDVARANLARANLAVSGARIVAPQAGTVLAIHLRAGEKVGEAGVATLGNVDRMMAELEVYQTDISKIAIGQTVTMSAQPLGEPVTGTVKSIGMMVERQSVMATEPAANADARVVRVKVALDPQSSARARTYTNLEVIARISVRSP